MRVYHIVAFPTTAAAAVHLFRGVVPALSWGLVLRRRWLYSYNILQVFFKFYSKIELLLHKNISKEALLSAMQVVDPSPFRVTVFCHILLYYCCTAVVGYDRNAGYILTELCCWVSPGLQQ